MKLSELKQLTTEELQARLVAEQLAYNQMYINHAVSPIDSPAKIRDTRRSIAQMKTLLRERELNNK